MSKKASGLGRDFFAILDDNLISDKKSASEMIRITDIEPRRDQPRKNFDREALDALAESIGVHGVLQPIIVRENPALPGLYEIIAGERRWRAAKMAGLSEIPAVILDGDDLKIAQVALIENIQREDLNPIEEAMAYDALIDKFDLTQDQVAKQVGKSRSAVTNALRLLELPEDVVKMLAEGELSAGHARALLGLNNKEEIAATAGKIAERELSVRETEALVRRLNTAKEPKEEFTELDSEAGRLKVYIKEVERRTMSVLGKKVRITHTPRKKTVEISYESNEELENMLKALCGNDIFDNI
ncbi:MAG: ParB/RepB/Spo0J family partition protein [Ruminococcaceae bacterium]|nr:ParB/RepB/Spo0J family partition protein [Oscillospiraceae bacterium]